MISQQQIDDITRRIASSYHPDRIILFGSYAYGNPSEDSDLDLLVVLPFEGRPVYKSIEILEMLHPTVPLDLIVRTPQQLASRLAQHDFFLNEVIQKGKVLYEASH
uniref:DNA polymerase beta domain protein region n=1 Tax=Geobacter sp. (strain M21) TaxID=443144 RepID=C6E064_GEOSM